MENAQNHILLFQPPTQVRTIQGHKYGFLKKKISLYIHIPFCEKKCFFCSIVTCQKYTEEYINQYVDVLTKEISDLREHFICNEVECIHIGGGTPSVLNVHQIGRIFDTLKSNIRNFDSLEVIFEAETSSLSDEKIDYLSDLGNVLINLGVQTFDPTGIRKNNRWSSQEDVIGRIRQIASRNFKSVGIDIMCNLPFTTLETTLSDIDIAVGLNVNHVSLYPLRVEPDSIFYNANHKYNEFIISEETQLENYSSAARYLRLKGYNHYSIFHFSNQEEETYLYSRNQMYGKEWLGLGVAAYSYYNNEVFANSRNLDDYIAGGMQEDKAYWLHEEQDVTKNIIRQFVFSLRIMKVTRAYYIQKYGETIFNLLFTPLINYLKEHRYINEVNDSFYLSDLGIVEFPNIEVKILDEYQKMIQNTSALVENEYKYFEVLKRIPQ